jgi:Xaa-Pro aminopeptidase
MIWPSPSPVQSFVGRRQALLDRYAGPAAFGSGLSRVRNFEANRFSFRSESHFLYFIGRSIEGALLCFDDGEARLYAPTPDPAEELWTGKKPTLAELSEALQIEVSPLDAFEPPEDVATLAPDDTESALWLESLLERAVDAGAATEPGDLDAELTDIMIELRLRHDNAAIAQMEQAAKVSCLAHRAGMGATAAATREADLRAAMESTITACGMIPAYNSIVTAQGHVLHHETSFGELKPGQLVLADVGAEGPEGWASDVTRTWPVSGRFTRIQQACYEAVLAAQQAAVEMVAPDVRFMDVHRAAGRKLVEGLVEAGLFRGSAEQLLDDGAAAVFFPHGVGHLLGLDVHDMEDLGDRAAYEPGFERSEHPAERFLRLDRYLKPRMAVTIEPGFYCIPGILEDAERMAPLRKGLVSSVLEDVRNEVNGIRIEDDVLVTDTGYRVLTSGSPKAVDEVQRAVRGA